MFISKSLQDRVRVSISIAWKLLQSKIQGGLIDINKEASLQLHFANILQNVLSLITYSEDEFVSISLEKTLNNGTKNCEADVFISCNKNTTKYTFAIEMKCYRQVAGSGKKRGGQEVFHREVYTDLYNLENYISNKQCDEGIFLAMTDYDNIVKPKAKRGTFWKDVDISNNIKITSGKTFTYSGSSFSLKKSYIFKWKKVGDFYYLKL